MFVAKQVADLITYTRAILGVFLVWLGATEGKAALPSVAVLMLFDWIRDCTDGYFARRSRVQYRTWIGDHDLEVDIFVGRSKRPTTWKTRTARIPTTAPC